MAIVPATASKYPVQLTQTTVIVSQERIAGLNAEFAATGIAHMPGFLSPQLLGVVKKQILTSTFRATAEVYAPHSSRLMGTTLKVPDGDPVILALHFMFNRQELFQLARDVSGISRPGNFVCRMHRTTPESEQHLDWHDDAGNGRVLGLNINLCDGEFTGGAFQIRDAAGEIRADVRQWAPGDAFLFRIGHGWQHRLNKVESGCRTVAVGWFRLTPDWPTIALAGFRTGRIIFQEKIHERSNSRVC